MAVEGGGDSIARSGPPWTDRGTGCPTGRRNRSVTIKLDLETYARSMKKKKKTMGERERE